jgi:hypothetical protein
MTIPTDLAERAGAWAGTNGFRLMPSDPLAEAAATATVSTAAGGNLGVVAYTWTHPHDGPQDGLLVVGPADEAEADAVTAFWGDSWHQSPAPRVCTGTVDGGVVTVGYEYATQWRWEIVVDLTDPDTLRLRMDNVIPEDFADEGTPAGPYPAMVMELRRSTTWR